MKNIKLSNLAFKPINKKPKVTNNKIANKKLYCVCIETKPNVFKAYVNIPSNLEFPDTVAIDFSKDSYNLKGKEKVFTVEKDSKGRSICIIRNKLDATNFPGLPSQYTPFKHKFVYSGYVIKINDKHYFDVTDVLDSAEYHRDLVSNIKYEIENND